MSYSVLKVMVMACCVLNALAEPQSHNSECDENQTAFPPDPKSTCCGRDAAGSIKILGGNQTLIDQFPWLVLFEYVSDGGPVKTLCGGSLISGRYVLTAAHCVTGPILLVGGPPKNVRLAEFDTSNEGPDCTTELSGKDCTEGTITIPIEEIIVHPDYMTMKKRNKNFLHDIALVRLTESVPYTDFIRPICLPTEDISSNPPEILHLTEAGWGTRPSNPIKMQQIINYVNEETCQSAYNQHHITLDPSHLCAGAGIQHYCPGNSGGPLMKQGKESTYEVIGVTSFGPRQCGQLGTPTVYTNVFKYKDWIKSVIKA